MTSQELFCISFFIYTHCLNDSTGASRFSTKWAQRISEVKLNKLSTAEFYYKLKLKIKMLWAESYDIVRMQSQLKGLLVVLSGIVRVNLCQKEGKKRKHYHIARSSWSLCFTWQLVKMLWKFSTICINWESIRLSQAAFTSWKDI